MSDHHDFGGHDPFGPDGHGGYEQFEPPEQPPPFDEHGFDDHHDDVPGLEPGEHTPWEPPHHTDPGEPAAEEPAPPGADALPDDPAAELFPPALDVGELPEPVDGFPWIDTASLGAVPAGTHDPQDPVRPEELAEYAGTDLPPGADPWAALAGSDDPATAALARWWREN